MRITRIIFAMALLGAAVWAENAAPQTLAAPPTQNSSAAARIRTLRARSAATAPWKGSGAEPSLEVRVQEMQDTVAQMHVLLKEMQAKAGNAKSSTAADNVRMWELLLNHLDASLAQARMTVAMRRAMSQRAMTGQTPSGAPNGAVPASLPTPAPTPQQ